MGGAPGGAAAPPGGGGRRAPQSRGEAQGAVRRDGEGPCQVLGLLGPATAVAGEDALTSASHRLGRRIQRPLVSAESARHARLSAYGDLCEWGAGRKNEIC